MEGFEEQMLLTLIMWGRQALSIEAKNIKRTHSLYIISVHQNSQTNEATVHS